MNSLLGHLADGHAGTFVCSFMGYELLSGGLNKLGPKRWKGVAAALCTLHRARELAKRLSINPIFPVDVTWDDLDAIDGLCDLMDFGARPATQAKFTTVHERRLVASAFLADDAQMTNGLLRFVRSASDNLFGIVIAVPAIVIQLTHAKASCPDGDLSIELADLTNPDITIEWTGTDQSVLSFQPDKAHDVPVRLT